MPEYPENYGKIQEKNAKWLATKLRRRRRTGAESQLFRGQLSTVQPDKWLSIRGSLTETCVSRPPRPRPESAQRRQRRAEIDEK
ncbi:hypothetical protein Y032_0085g1885 [Ancylostoma ceylanicum]|uniref:Uncharacterized protein n=1 Tax=Ancylostoma ceylanicum TaxID=53326 RepID=A0A016TQN0_9BILA|nr:hypothetical protein Y032_0085g1885 [Ancylostoma ceylanicum]